MTVGPKAGSIDGRRPLLRSEWKSLWSPRWWSNLRVLQLLQHQLDAAVELRISSVHHQRRIVDYFDIGLNAMTLDLLPFPRLVIVMANVGNQRPDAIDKVDIHSAGTERATHGTRTDEFAEPALSKVKWQPIAA